MLEKRRFVFFSGKTRKEAMMIEIISVMRPISFKEIEISMKNQTPIRFDGVNQLKKNVEVKIIIKSFHDLETKKEYFFLKGQKEQSNILAEGTAGIMKDSFGHYGQLILHI